MTRYVLLVNHKEVNNILHTSFFNNGILSLDVCARFQIVLNFGSALTKKWTIAPIANLTSMYA